MKSILLGVAIAVALTGGAFGQAIKLNNVAELSGGGATVGTNWKNGIDLAVEEINGKGGILGRKVEVTHADSQSNPEPRARKCRRRSTASPTRCWGRASPDR